MSQAHCASTPGCSPMLRSPHISPQISPQPSPQLAFVPQLCLGCCRESSAGVSVETLSICLNRGCRSFQRVTCCSGRARHRTAPTKRYAALRSQYREYLRQNSRPIGTKLMSHVPFVPWLSIYIYPPAFALHRLLSPLTTPNPSPRAELEHLGFSPELAFISITRSNKDPFRLGWKAEVSNEYAMKSVQRLSAGPCSSGLRHRNPPEQAWRFYVTEYSRV